MDDKVILKYLLGLGLETLIARSGQDLSDFIDGSGIQEAPPKEASPANEAPQPTSFDDERMARFNMQEDQRNKRD